MEEKDRERKTLKRSTRTCLIVTGNFFFSSIMVKSLQDLIKNYEKKNKDIIGMRMQKTLQKKKT